MWHEEKSDRIIKRMFTFDSQMGSSLCRDIIGFWLGGESSGSTIPFSDLLGTKQPAQTGKASICLEHSQTSPISLFSTLTKKAPWSGLSALLKITSEVALEPLNKGAFTQHSRTLMSKVLKDLSPFLGILGYNLFTLNVMGQDKRGLKWSHLGSPGEKRLVYRQYKGRYSSHSWSNMGTKLWSSI